MLSGKIFGIITSVIALVLIVPTILIVVTWNTLPGQSLYGVKTNLEKIPRFILGNTVLAAYYETKITDRRFSEATTLLNRDSTGGLAGLNSEMKFAAQKIQLSKSSAAKEQFIDSLVAYQDTLEKQKTRIIATRSVTTTATTSTTNTSEPTNNATTTTTVTQNQQAKTVPTTNPTTPPTTHTTPPVTPPTPPTTPPTTPPVTPPTPPTTPPTTPPVTPPTQPDPVIDQINQTQDTIDQIIQQLDQNDSNDVNQLENGVDSL